jgi:hypothetical protein
LTTPVVTNAGTLALSATGGNVITASTNGEERLRIEPQGGVTFQVEASTGPFVGFRRGTAEPVFGIHLGFNDLNIVALEPGGEEHVGYNGIHLDENNNIGLGRRPFSGRKLSIEGDVRIDGDFLSPGGSSFVGTVTTGNTGGSIIQRGSNSNGEFVRFADGTQICWRRNFSSSNCNISTGEGFRSDTNSWTFPVSFSSEPVITFDTSNTNIWTTSRSNSGTSGSWRLMGFLSRTGVSVDAVAFGRWK